MIGYRDGLQNPVTSDIRSLLIRTPTGNNLLQGVDVEFVFSADPTGTVGSWPDGCRGTWQSGANLVIGRYTRATGWKSTTLT